MVLNLLLLVHLTDQAEESVSHFSGSYDTPMHRGRIQGHIEVVPEDWVWFRRFVIKCFANLAMLLNPSAGSLRSCWVPSPTLSFPSCGNLPHRPMRKLSDGPERQTPNDGPMLARSHMLQPNKSKFTGPKRQLPCRSWRRRAFGLGPRDHVPSAIVISFQAPRCSYTWRIHRHPTDYSKSNDVITVCFRIRTWSESKRRRAVIAQRQSKDTT